MIFNAINFNNREEWLSLRKYGIGGSDASACLDMNPYKTKRDLYLEKIGAKAPPDISNSRLVIYGTKAEDHLRELFKIDYQEFEVYHPDLLLYRKDKEYMRASLDGIINVKEDMKFYNYSIPNRANNEIYDKGNIKYLKKGMKGILEIKTTEILSSMKNEKWHNQIPQNYYIQCLHYLNVTGFDFFILRVKLVFNRYGGVITHEIRDYCLLREECIEDLKVEEDAVSDFWENYVMKNIEPPVNILPIN